MKGLSLSTPMMIAWLAGRKDLTRRLGGLDEVNRRPDEWKLKCVGSVKSGLPKNLLHRHGAMFICPESQWIAPDKPMHKFIPSRYPPGEAVYVREAYAKVSDGEKTGICYQADGADQIDKSAGERWLPPFLMPEWASRSHALIKSVRPERIQSITTEEIIREGFVSYMREHDACCDLQDQFKAIWNTLHPGSWEKNEWVWRIELEKLP